MAPARYEIVVRGRLGGPLVRWFDDLAVSASGPHATCLHGWFPDQPALHGVLTRLGVELATVAMPIMAPLVVAGLESTASCSL